MNKHHETETRIERDYVGNLIIPGDKVALLSRSNFGSGSAISGKKMRHTLELSREQAPELEADGEMHGDCALDEALRSQVLPTSPLNGAANLLVCPNVDAGNIAYNLLKTEAGSNVAVGPFLLGVNAPGNILTSSATVRQIVNMATLTVPEANRVQFFPLSAKDQALRIRHLMAGASHPAERSRRHYPALGHKALAAKVRKSEAKTFTGCLSQPSLSAGGLVYVPIE